MLFGVLSFVDLAGGVVALADATQIRHSIGSQNPVTAHSLENTNHDLSASTEDEVHLQLQHFSVIRVKVMGEDEVPP